MLIKLSKPIIAIGLLITILMLFASLLTTNPYMRMNKGLYDSHAQITYDHDFVSRQLIDYLNYRHDDLTFGANENDPNPVMRPIEIRHMEDVKDLYTLLRITALISLLLVVSLSVYIYKKDIKAFYLTYRNIYLIPAMFIAFIGVWFLIDFDRVFVLFHELFFDNDDWLLRMDDVLIQLLPQNFWFLSGGIIIFGTIITFTLIYLANEKFIKPKIKH